MELISACKMNDFEKVKMLLENDNIIINFRDNNNNTSLIIAVTENNYNIVDILLTRGANVNVVNNDGNTALIIAVIKNNNNIVKLLLSKNANINAKMINEDSPVMVASFYGFTDILELLLLCNNNFGDDIEYGLIIAIEKGNMDCIDILLKHKANINFRGLPLKKAISRGDVHMIEYLLKNGANPTIGDKFSDENSLTFAIKLNKFEIFKMLYSRVNDHDLIHELIFAIYHGRSDCVELILTKDIDINRSIDVKANVNSVFALSVHDNYGMIQLTESKINVCPLIFAIYMAMSTPQDIKNRMPIIDILLSKKNTRLNISASDPHNKFMSKYNNICQLHPICIALLDSQSDEGYYSNDLHKQIINELMEKNQKDNYKFLPACMTSDKLIKIIKITNSTSILRSLIDNHMIITNNNMYNELFEHSINEDNHEMIKLLLKCYGNCEYIIRKEHSTIRRMTLLHMACEKGKIDIVKILLAEGAKIHIKSSYDKQTEIHIASERGYHDIVELLLQNGSNVDDRCHKERTPLMYASEKGCINTVKVLLKYNANLEHKGKYLNDTFTALAIACINNHREVAELLLKCGANANQLGTTFHYMYQNHIRNSGNIYQLLIDMGANVDQIDVNGQTILQSICNNLNSHQSYDDIIKILLQGGATLNNPTKISRYAKQTINKITNIINIEKCLADKQIDKLMKLCRIDVIYELTLNDVTCLNCKNELKCSIIKCKHCYCLDCLIKGRLQNNGMCTNCLTPYSKIIYYDTEQLKLHMPQNKPTNNILDKSVTMLKQLFLS